MMAAKARFWESVNWPAATNIKAFYTTRYSVDLKASQYDQAESDFNEFNLALHVNDDSTQVLDKRKRLKDGLSLPSEPVWLEQIHSTNLVNIDKKPSNLDLQIKSNIQADGSLTRTKGVVCCVMTADCLPVLLSNKQGDWVAAVHAGWRGLAGGIIENAIALYLGDSSDLIAWLGPAISQVNFEVGSEVRDAFLLKNKQFEHAFIASSGGKFKADLYAIAAQILSEKGIKSFGGEFCTYRDSEKFYSYRRNPNTGRMASLIWID
jgi:polyphenol oxidase